MEMRLVIDLSDPPPEPVPPEGGWHKPDCTFESHRWGITIEEGRAFVECLDPCDPSLFDPSGNTPTCLVDWLNEDFSTPEPIPVRVVYIDDSTPSTPAGPAEWGYWLEVRPLNDEEPPEGGSSKAT